MKTLQSVQTELHGIISQGSDLALAVLKKKIKPTSEKYNGLLTLETQYHEVSRQLLQDLISSDVASLEFSKFKQTLIDFVNSLQEADLPEIAVTSPDGSALPDIYNGEVLYRIPKKMAVGVEEECIVRMAFDRQKLLHDFQVQVGDVMKDLRISDVMGVELLDPNGDKAFSITTLNDSVQFLQKDLITEWIFCVTPLKEGQYPLVLRISIIEMIDGVERKRNEVLKERVEILLTLEPGEKLNDFQKGYTWQVTDSDEQRAAAAAESARSVPSTSPSMPSPQTPRNAAKAVGLGLFGKVVAGIATAVVGIVAVNHFVGKSDDVQPMLVVETEVAKQMKRLRKYPNRQELEQFAQENPTAPEAQTAMMLMDSLEKATWDSALASNDEAEVDKYLSEYPEGKYLDEATQRKWDFDNKPVAVEETPKPDDAEGSEQVVKKPESGSTGSGKKPKTPVSPKKPQTNSQPTKTTPKPTPKPTTPSKPAPQDKPRPVPIDPNKPVVPAATARRPVYKGCSKKSKSEEEACTKEKIQNFLSQRLTYPQKAIDQKLEGTVNVSFVIERNGSITDVHATNDIGGGCAAEAVKLVKKMPKFQPGLNTKGEPVRVLFNQPVRFQLN